MSIYLIIVISLLFSAFFSGMEIAFVSSNKLRFEVEKKEHHWSNSLLSVFYRHSEQFIATTLVGNNVALVIFSIKMAELLGPYIAYFVQSNTVITITETIIATVLVLFTGEFLPKTIFKANPNFWLRLFAPLFSVFYILLYPIAKFSTSLSFSVLKLLKVKIDKNKKTVFSRIDLGHLIQESIDYAKPEEEIEQDVRILQNALDFSSVKLRNCMVPRTEIIAVDEAEATLEQLKALFISTGHSKILIYRENIDNIIGYIHSSEMLLHPDSWQKYINHVPVVPETMQANKLMKLLNKQKKSMAIVVDEFGGTAGIVTLEDLLEEIFGEIEDEHDHSGLIIKQISGNEYILSGRLEIDAVNEQFHLEIPESDDYVTIAGFILTNYQNLPKVNDVVHIMHFDFRILKVENHRIDLVKLHVHQ